MYEIYQRLLDEKGLKNADVSRETGISNMTLSDWKRGKSTPKADKMQKIADFLGVSVSYLMGWDEDDNKLVVSGNPVEHLKLASLYEKLNDKKKKDIFEIMELLENADDDKIVAIKMLLK